MSVLSSPSWSGRVAVAAELAALAFLAAFAAGVSLTAFMHLFDPVHWGLWVSPRMVLFGVVDDPSVAQEVLGERIYAVAALVTVLCGLAGRELWQSLRARLRG